MYTPGLLHNAAMADIQSAAVNELAACYIIACYYAMICNAAYASIATV